MRLKGKPKWRFAVIRTKNREVESSSVAIGSKDAGTYPQRSGLGLSGEGGLECAFFSQTHRTRLCCQIMKALAGK